MAEGRELMLDLRARDRSGEELSTLLDKTAQDLSAVSPATFRLLVLGEARPLRAAASDEIYWLGREALSNAFRHSGAEVIEVELSYDPREFRVRFRDNGSGIAADVLQRGRRENHWGLPGMRERATKIGAQMDIWSARNAGTEIEIRIPAVLAYQNPRHAVRFRWARMLFDRFADAHE
jgi:signal transduction histidine kinase